MSSQDRHKQWGLWTCCQGASNLSLRFSVMEGRRPQDLVKAAAGQAVTALSQNFPSNTRAQNDILLLPVKWILRKMNRTQDLFILKSTEFV